MIPTQFGYSFNGEKHIAESTGHGMQALFPLAKPNSPERAEIHLGWRPLSSDHVPDTESWPAESAREARVPEGETTG